MENAFTLLNDQPLGKDDPDHLDAAPVADGLADLVYLSRATAPFVLAIDGRWGTGKSSVMAHLSRTLEERHQGAVKVVLFNAWRAGTASALAGVIKSVIGQLDGNIVRRQLRRPGLTRGLRVLASVLAAPLRLNRMVDQLWAELSIDAKGRNDLRAIVGDIVTTWVDASSGVPRRMIVVFVDDLDRCGDATVIEVCEAVKLYLDLPGVVFVLGCDLGMIAQRAVVPGAAGDPALVREWLEKIIQVNYRVPVPTAAQVRALIEGYAARSGTLAVFTEPVRELVGQRSAGNPRSIKRLINSFIVEHRLDSGWHDLGPEILMNAVLIQHYHPDFYRLIIERTDDVIADFLAYRAARELLRTGPAEKVEFRGTVTTTVAGLDEEVPAAWPALAREAAFTSLLEGIADPAALQRKLRRQPLNTAPVFDDPEPVLALPDLTGLDILWVDDRPKANALLRADFEARGATVRTALSGNHAAAQLAARPPDVVISDVSRGADPDAGFRDATRLREDLAYQGPIMFFTSGVPAGAEQRLRDLEPASLTTNSGTLTTRVSEEAARRRIRTVLNPAR